jgi:hypothetical protein
MWAVRDRCRCSDVTSAFGGIAEVVQRPGRAGHDANDPNRTLGATSSVGNRLGLGSVLRVTRQAHGEDRAFARLARHGHIAAHHARQLAGDG